ncbi:hypothetical protein, partial [Actinophytocola sp. KF-1]
MKGAFAASAGTAKGAFAALSAGNAPFAASLVLATHLSRRQLARFAGRARSARLPGWRLGRERRVRGIG